MSGDPNNQGQGPQQAWLWNERTRGWDKNPAYLAQNSPPPGPRRKKWPWVLGPVLLFGIVVAVVVNNESFEDGYQDARSDSGVSTSSAGSGATTEPAPTSQPAVATGDDSLRTALKQAGVSTEMVAALGVVGDETGYGISKSTPMNQEQREGFAYTIMLLCREITAGGTSWEQSVSEDVFNGAERADAQRLNDYARTEFCPRVRAEAPTTAPAAPIAPAEAPPVVLSADVVIDGRTVTVTGTLPLPDGAQVSIMLSRIEYFGFSEEKHYDESASGSAVVKDGRFTGVVVDDQTSSRDFAEAYNVGEPPERQIKISDFVAVELTFDPRDQQSPAVVEAVGGEDAPGLASSPQGEQFGSLTDDPYWRLEWESEHELPFEL